MDESNFMGYDLVIIPLNYHFDCLLKYSDRYKTLLNNEMASVCGIIKQIYRRRQVDFGSKKRLVVSVIAAHTWLQEARRARILSSFLELGMINEIKDLALTLEELREKQWIRVKPG